MLTSKRDNWANTVLAGDWEDGGGNNDSVKAQVLA